MGLVNPFVVQDEDVYVVTQRGKNELQESETSLSPAEIELLVRIDGQATVGEIKKSTRLLGAEDVVRKIEALARGGYLDLASNQLTQSLDFASFFGERPKRPSAKTADAARSEVSSGVSTLHKDGYYVRIARRRASRKRPAKDQVLTVVVIEDDPSLAKFLRQYLELEGFATRVAGNREEIVAALRRPPLPDLVLLDVMLPDTDGFHVLLKMREHPALKTVPVLMLTASATRDAVLKGLAGGADGYVTKPFEPDALVKAVKTVLGMPKNPFDRRGQDPWAEAGRTRK